MQRIWRWQNIRTAALCCGLGLLTATLLPAQQQREREADPAANPQRQQAQQQGGEKQFCLATELIGMNVKVKGEEDWGQIQNLIINKEGDVTYLALSAETQAEAAAPRARILRQDPAAAEQEGSERSEVAAGGKLTLVPWDVVKFHAGATKAQSYVSVEIEKERLTTAPSFTQQQLTAQQGQAQIAMQVDRFFNVREQRGAARPELNRPAEEGQSPQNRERQNDDN